MFSRGLLLAAVAGVLFLSSEPLAVRSGAAQPPPARVFVGALADSDALIAVVLDGRQVLAYVCDGTAAGVDTWGWFAGEAEAPQLTLVATNGAVLLVDLSGETPSGTVINRTGHQHGFGTEAARAPAGLWRAQGLVAGQPVLAAWVVLNDGSQRGAQVRGGTVGTVGFIDPTSDFNRPQTVAVGGGTLEARPVGFIDPTTDFNR